MIIESVNANHRGRYQCLAVNQQGMSHSNSIHVDVQCKFFFVCYRLIH